jgi:23S rRNA pseudouridine1911/1915/1917 synthase
MIPDPLFPVIYEDDTLLVADKPADLVCHPTKGDVYSSLISRVRLYLGEASEGHMINRLDRETSGVVLIAKDRDTARSLRMQWEARKVEKKYDAIVYGWPEQDTFESHAPLGKDRASPVVIKDCVIPDGVTASTVFRVVKRWEHRDEKFALLEAKPRTGRKHQIRIHLQHLGHPIVGDKLYGLGEHYYLALVEGTLTHAQRKELILPCHALHARQVRLIHQGKEMCFQSVEEQWFRSFHQTNSPLAPVTVAK